MTNTQMTIPQSIYACFISRKPIHGSDKLLFHVKDLKELNTDMAFQLVNDTSSSCKIGLEDKPSKLYHEHFYQMVNDTKY